MTSDGGEALFKVSSARRPKRGKRKMKKGKGKETEKTIFAKIDKSEYDKMLEIKRQTRFSIADQIRAGIRNIISNPDQNLKRGN